MKIEFEDMNPTMAADGVEMRTTRISDDIVLMRVRCAAGTDFGPAMRGLPHDACPCEHWGYLVSGQMDITTHDGQAFTLTGGDAFHLQPGHLPSFPMDTEWLDYSPTRQVKMLLDNMGLALP
jgi:hypothetical protein